MAHWCAPVDGELCDRAILTRAFVDCAYPFNVAAKAFPAQLARRAFEALGDIHADSSEDVLEYFAIAFFAHSYRGLPSCRYYVYHLGDGGSGLADMTADQFARALRSYRAVEAVGAFLESQGAREAYADIFEAHRMEQLRALMRTWDSYVRPQDKRTCLERVLGVWPREDVIDVTCEFGSQAIEVLRQVIGADFTPSLSQSYACGLADGAKLARAEILETGTYKLGQAVGVVPRKVLALLGR